ncbi:hypothetical protein [Saccharothrix xinjiangensis]|uniref:Uncharacterized protein n=1 Tax=Saccharothrix xinjiangensis TaxID=204798 RepID=A0ABV9YF03_9PSEU
MTARSQDPWPGPRPADPHGLTAGSGAREPVVASAAVGAVVVVAGAVSAVATHRHGRPGRASGGGGS